MRFLSNNEIILEIEVLWCVYMATDFGILAAGGWASKLIVSLEPSFCRGMRVTSQENVSIKVSAEA